MMARTIPVKMFDDERGRLTVADPLPFAVERLFWIRNVPSWATRGGHAHRACDQILISLCGQLVVEIFDGRLKNSFRIDEKNMLYVPALHWVEVNDFRSDSLLLVAASDSLDEADYMRKMDDFLDLVGVYE